MTCGQIRDCTGVVFGRKIEMYALALEIGVEVITASGPTAANMPSEGDQAIDIQVVLTFTVSGCVTQVTPSPELTTWSVATPTNRAN